MNYGRSEHVKNCVRELATLLNPNQENLNEREVEKAVRLLRPTNLNAPGSGAYSSAIKMRIRQSILNNNPSDGQNILINFEKQCDLVRKLNPHILHPFLEILEPLSFQARRKLRSFPDSLFKYDASNFVESSDDPTFSRSGRDLAVDHTQLSARGHPIHQPPPPPPPTLQPQPSFQEDKRGTKESQYEDDGEDEERVMMHTVWVGEDVEQKLLVDLIFVFQGISGKHIKFDSRSDTYVIDPTLNLNSSATDVVLSLCELGWLYGKLAQYLSRVFNNSPDSLVHQQPATASSSATSTLRSRTHPPAHAQAHHTQQQQQQQQFYIGRINTNAEGLRGGGVGGGVGGGALGLRGNASSAAAGAVTQAFGFALQEELHDYFRLLAVLEQDLHGQHREDKRKGKKTDTRSNGSVARSSAHTSSTHVYPSRIDSATLTSVAAAANSDGTDGTDGTGTSSSRIGSGGGGGSGVSSGLTLLRLKAWLHEPIERMCQMVMMVDGVESLVGGAVVSKLYAHAQHGDETGSSTLVNRILRCTCAPLYAILTRWVLYGELVDPYNEFFVAVNNYATIATGSAAYPPRVGGGLNNNNNNNVWNDTYVLRSDMLPSYFTLAFAKKILLIGKSINFIRLCLQKLPRVSVSSIGTGDSAASSDAIAGVDMDTVRKSYRAVNKGKRLGMYGQVLSGTVDEEQEKNDGNDSVRPTAGGGGGGDGRGVHMEVDTSLEQLQLVRHAKGDDATTPRTPTLNGHSTSRSAAVTSVASVTTQEQQQQQQQQQQGGGEGGGGGGDTVAQTVVPVTKGAPKRTLTMADVLGNVLTAEVQQTIKSLSYGSESVLQHLVVQLSSDIDRKLINLMMSRFHVQTHLLALKKYMLLGQGDFVMCLMDAVGPELRKRANQLFRHNLTGILEGAIRASNAQYEPAYVSDRIGIRLLENAAGDSGWEVFSLDYAIDAPLNAIVHTECIRKYRIAFHMLWRLKRVEWTLSTAWKQNSMFQHTSRNYISPSFRAVLHRCYLNRAMMRHVVNNLCAFLMFEVLETAWHSLQETVSRATCLDDVIEAHSAYLTEVLDRALLAPRHEALNMQLQQLLHTVLKFCHLEETLINDALASISRHKLARAAAEERSRHGQWGVTSAAEAEALEGVTVPEHVVRRMDDTVKEYGRQFDALMHTLGEQSEHAAGDVLRFLTFRLDFNAYHAAKHAQGAAVGLTSTPPPALATPLHFT